MTPFTTIPAHIEDLLEERIATTSRRDFLKTSGMLVVSFGAAAVAGPFVTGVSAQAAGMYPDPNFRQLDSWIVIHQDNTATFYVGKTDCGQGTGTAFTFATPVVRSTLAPVSATLKRLPPINSPYVTFFDGSAATVITAALTAS